METKTFYIYGKANMPRLKEIKTSMSLGYLVQPINLTNNWDKHSNWGKVLAWGAKPDHPCDYIEVADYSTDKQIRDALQWVLEDKPNKAAKTPSNFLETILGPGVKELTSEESKRYNDQRKIKNLSKTLNLDKPGDTKHWQKEGK